MIGLSGSRATSSSRAIRSSLLVVALAALASPLLPDVGTLHVSSDYDAEFARAADLLESGGRAEAGKILSEIRVRAGQRAWEARVDLLLGTDADRRKDFAEAIARLTSAPAASIGLESYRRDRLARDLAAAGRTAEAVREYHALEKEDEPYAGRTRTALDFARLLAKNGSASTAAGVLARAARDAPSGSLDLAPDRLVLALRLGDASGARTLARQILLESPLADFSGAPAEVRRFVAREEAGLSPADLARRGRALIAAGDSRRGARLLRGEASARWPPEERSLNLLTLARAETSLKNPSGALAALRRVPDDGSAVAFEARLLSTEIALQRLLARSKTPLAAVNPAVAAIERDLRALTGPEAPPAVRSSARDHLIRIAYETDAFDAALDQARALQAEAPGTRSGFEPLWRLSWNTYRSGDCVLARQRFEVLATLYGSPDYRRRLTYWRARCLEREGLAAEAGSLFRALAAAHPPDLYALFARRRVPAASGARTASLPDPSEATATFRRVDELLRLRLFPEASAEARGLPASRGRDLRLAEADFALGRFAAASAAAKRAFPEMGTAEEGRVPDGWRRLYYPIEEGGFLAERAKEFRLDPSILRGLVRQESFFEPAARSRAGALGLTQLLPSTARSLARSVLRVRYRRAFLYDPSFNARLGAAYLRRLYDEFGNDPVFALAAYNGGPGRMSGVLKNNPGLAEDELFESHPAYESRDYVRRVMLYAESYRELYP